MRMLHVASLGLAVSLVTITAGAAVADWIWEDSVSARAFETSMEGGNSPLLLANFPLSHWSVKFDNTSTFQNLVNDRYRLRNAVAERVLDICLEQVANADVAIDDVELCYSARRFLREAWVQEDESGFVAAHRLATNFLDVDDDNWFSFESVRDRSMDYLATGNRRLRLYKGFNSVGVLVPGGIPVADLPVVIDMDEKTITIWAGTLYD